MSHWSFVLAAVASCAVLTLGQYCTDSKIDLVFLVDCSGSICDNDPDGLFKDPDNPGRDMCNNWSLVKSFMVQFVEQLGGIGWSGNRVGLATFSNNGNYEFGLRDYTDQRYLTKQLSKLPYRGGKTATASGLTLVATKIFGTADDRDDVRNVLIVITDGAPTVPENSALIDARTAADYVKTIATTFTVGVTADIKTHLLEYMSSPPQELGRNYFTSASFSELASIRKEVITQTCQEQTPAPSGCSDTIIDLAILVDGSASICGNCGGCDTCNNYELVKTFVYGVIDKLGVGPDGARFAVVQYANTSETLFNFNTYTNGNDMETAIRNMNFPDSRTNTSGGLRQVRQTVFNSANGDRAGVRNVVLVLINGNPTVEADQTLNEARMLRVQANAEVIVIGVTESVNKTILREMSSPPQLEDTNWFATEDFDTLINLITNIGDTACQTPAPPVTEPTPSPLIDPTPSPSQCRWAVDIIFILDSSGSIGYNHFQIMKKYIADLVDQFDVGFSTRVGLVQFADDVTLVFRLGEYTSFEDIRDEIDGVQYINGASNTANAITYARNMFADDSARPDSAKVAVLLTDGGSINKVATFAAAAEARKTMEIVVMGLGDWIDKYELQAIASDSYTTNLIMVDDYDDLPNYVDSMKAMLCNDVNECANGPCRNNGECVDMMNQYYCICTENYGGKDCGYRCTRTPEVAFILDSSGSIGKDNFQKVVDFSKSLALQLPLDNGAKVALETFSDDVTVYMTVGDDQGVMAVMDAMTIPYFVGRSTNTAEALNQVVNRLFRDDDPNRPNYVLLLTDGRSNDMQATWEAAMATRSAGVTIIPIGVGSSARYAELRGIASAPVTSNVIQVARFSDLQSRLSDLRDLVCNAENECSGSPCGNGGTCHDLPSGYYCTCPEPWTGKTCERSCGSSSSLSSGSSGRLDLVIILDRSGSIRHEKFDDVKQYIADILKEYEVYDDKVRVACVAFSDDATNIFYLNKYSKLQDISEAILRIEYSGERTNIASAFELVRTDVLVSRNGDRDNAENVVLLFTDGGANIREEDTLPESIRLRVEGARIITMSIGTQIDVMEMMAVASAPSSMNVITTSSFSTMNTMIPNFVDATCNNNNDCIDNPCLNGGTCIDGYNQYTCVCPGDHTGENCDRECPSSYDVAFVLDVSGSLYDVYALGMAVFREIIQGLEFRFDQTRAGLVLYSDTASVRFHLNTYQDKRDILEALSLKDYGGRTNTQAALQLSTDEIFQSNNGDRSQVPNIVILATDGSSNMQATQTLQKAQDLKSNGAQVYVIAIGGRVNMDEVNGMATQATSDYVYRVYSTGDVSTQANKLLNVLC